MTARPRFWPAMALLLACLAPQAARAQAGGAIALDAQGRVYFVDTHRGILWRVERVGQRTALARSIHTDAIAVMPDGTVYIPTDDFTDTFRWRVTIVAPNGGTRDTVITTGIAVTGGRFIGIDTAGIYFQRGAELVRVSLHGQTTTLMYRLPPMTIGAVAPLRAGRVALVAGNVVVHSLGDTISDVVGDSVAGFSELAGESARFNHLVAIQTNGGDTTFVADYGNRRVRRVDLSRNVMTMAHLSWPWRPTGIALRGDTIYVLERGALPIPGLLAGVIGTPRVQRILPEGRVETVTSVGNTTARTTIVMVIFGVAALMMYRRRRTG